MEALYRKYRPSTFADVVGQEHVKTTLQNQILSGSVAHAYLFTGPRGIGKTTVARLVAKAVNCLALNGGEPCNACDACKDVMSGSSLDVAEIDAASQTGVENVRENIIESVRFSPNKLKRRVYIIDEVHMLSTSSFNALLKTLEEPPAHAVFILATTELHKVPATVISRCQRFDFRRVSVETIVERLKGITRDEGANVDEDVLLEIARHADGGLRDAESMLGQVLALDEKRITMEIASLVIPATNRLMVDAFVTALAARDAKIALGLVNDALWHGVDLPQFTENVVAALRDRMLADLSSELAPLIESLLEARRHMKGARMVQLPLELAIMKCCLTQNDPKVQAGRLDSVRAEPVVAPAIVSQAAEVRAAPTVSPADPVLPTEERIEPVSTALGDVPVLDLEDVRRKWPEVFEQIKACNATLPMVMQTGELTAVEGNSVEIAFAYPVYVEAVNQDKNRKLLEQVLTRVLGRPVRVRAKHVKKEVEEVVDQLIDAFGGTVV
ncbi:DNA polymerase III, subunit gamma and tau [Candidatus Uhrbacteria bacterium RIFOXYB12_FULL_58_10]|nr:MAG: DNA polymerase III, subunit gamma and tau [Candidatus Uhrbacteria bacterium RIFOXYB12_FULL_58_10]OGL99686.1 MAG: DNA polymerase III, subunit gamma and tau [Candidatus Uhrbacteria bacterium RIFOXYC12_FULL_57_11]